MSYSPQTTSDNTGFSSTAGGHLRSALNIQDIPVTTHLHGDGSLHEQQQFHDSLTHKQPFVAPIQCLPVEILANIFMALPRDPHVEPFSTSNSPILLTHVCSRWRNVAITTPRLWDIICFNVDCTLKVKPFTMEFWETWLSRSGACPLTIRVVFEENANADHLYRHVVDVLVSHSRRWRDVNIARPGSLDMYSAVKGSLPILEKLMIVSPADELGSLSMFEVAPRLRDVVLASAIGSIARCRLPWAQLQLITVGLYPVHEIFFILQSCPNIEYGDLCAIGNTDGLIHPLMRPKLRRLFIRANDVACHAGLLDALTCPALQYLEIQPLTHGGSVTLPHKQISTFITRSSCNLHRLTLGAVSLLDPGLILCLQEMPFLRELDLYVVDDPLSPDAWQLLDRMTYDSALTTRDQAALLLPKLTEFWLDVSIAPNSDVLQTMLRSRWVANSAAQAGGVARLQSVHLIIHNEVDRKQFGCMRDWQNEGLNIHVEIGGNRWL